MIACSVTVNSGRERIRWETCKNYKMCISLAEAKDFTEEKRILGEYTYLGNVMEYSIDNGHPCKQYWEYSFWECSVLLKIKYYGIWRCWSGKTEAKFSMCVNWWAEVNSNVGCAKLKSVNSEHNINGGLTLKKERSKREQKTNWRVKSVTETT